MKDHKFCSHCGNKSKLSAKVCSKCGKHYRKIIVKSRAELCPNCSSLRRSNAKFCRNCGYQFVPSTPAEEPIDQPHIPGVELPPAAKVPPQPAKSSTPPLQRPVTRRGTSGLILTADELKRLRNMKTGQILFYPKTPRKPDE